MVSTFFVSSVLASEVLCPGCIRSYRRSRTAHAADPLQRPPEGIPDRPEHKSLRAAHAAGVQRHSHSDSARVIFPRWCDPLSPTVDVLERCPRRLGYGGNGYDPAIGRESRCGRKRFPPAMDTGHRGVTFLRFLWLFRRFRGRVHGRLADYLPRVS